MMSDASYRLVPWTLGALILSAIPHAFKLPLHISLLIIGLLLTRLFLHKKVLRMPANSFKYLLAGVCLATVLITFRTLTGSIAGGAFLLFMASIKTFETNTLRDHTALILASFFIIVSFVLDNNEIWVGLYVLFVSGFAILVLLKISAPTISNELLFKKAKAFLLYGIPLSIVLFILFPRIPGPLWGVPNSANKASTGISDSMTPGSISELVKSDALAFRAKFENTEPKRSQLYWRGPVLHDFDGSTWSGLRLQTARQSETNKSSTQESENQLNYNIILEAHNNDWLFTLDYADKLPEKSTQFYDYQVSHRSKVRKTISYSASANLSRPLEDYASDFILRRNLALPSGAKKTKELVQNWKNKNLSDEEIVQTALKMFNKELYSYTLSPQPLDLSNSVDDFLFRTREGFCEHYASAFTVMMRAANIPARVVTGYLGGEKNTLSGYYRISQADAHAWSEVYLQGKGWTRVDPTGAIAPERIEQNLEDTFPDEGLGGLFSGIPFMLALENGWFALNTAWFEWVLEFDAKKQIGLLEKLGFKNPDWRALVYLLVGGILSGVLFMSFLFWLQNRKIFNDPLQKIYHQFLMKLHKKNITTSYTEGPNALMQRLSTGSDENLNKKAINKFIQAYIEARYYSDAKQKNKTKLKRLNNLLHAI